MTQDQVSMVISAMQKLSLANGASNNVEALLLLKRAMIILNCIQYELEREIN